MSLHRTINCVFITCISLFASTTLAELPSQAAMLANACAACHGSEGSSQGPATPSIAGVSPDYFIDAMEAFKEGERPATIMDRIAKGYDEEQIELMAKYFSSLRIKATEQTFDPALAKKGAALHKEHCEKCHENGGRSSDDDAGILAGQKTPYLRYTLKDMLEGKREVPTKMMKKLEKIHLRMGKDGIEQLLNFYASER